MSEHSGEQFTPAEREEFERYDLEYENSRKREFYHHKMPTTRRHQLWLDAKEREKRVAATARATSSTAATAQPSASPSPGNQTNDDYNTEQDGQLDVPYSPSIISGYDEGIFGQGGQEAAKLTGKNKSRSTEMTVGQVK